MTKQQQAQHTPGPWVCVDDDFVTSKVGTPIARITRHFGAPANARLIAAAPELLAALKDVIGPRDIDAKHQCAGCGRVYDEPEDITLAFCPADDCANYIARAALAKAEGR